MPDQRTRKPLSLRRRNERSRQQVRASFQASEACGAAILETALDSIIMIDQQGRIIEFNPAAEQVFGYRRDAVIGQELAELIIPPPCGNFIGRGSHTTW